MAKNIGNSRNTDFLSLVEDEFEKCYKNDISEETHFKGIRISTNNHKLDKQTRQK